MVENTEKSVLIVLGMHRSGTSAVAGICHRLGVGMGDSFLEATPENPRGYYEDIEFTALHDKILESFSMSWKSLGQLPSGWQHLSRIEVYRNELRDLILKRSQQGMWGIKDPRLCRLLPLWLSVLEELHISPRFLLVVRNPYEVAQSLHERDAMSLHSALTLWFIHNIEAEYYSRPFQRSVVLYPYPVERWDAIYKILHDELNIISGPLSQAVRQSIDTFISKDLYRQRVPDYISPIQEGFPSITDLWSLLRQGSLGQDTLERLNTMWYESRLWLYAFTDMFEEAQNLNTLRLESEVEVRLKIEQHIRQKEEQISILQDELDCARHAIELTKKEVYSIRSSNSWRATAPLRCIKNRMVRFICRLTR